MRKTLSLFATIIHKDFSEFCNEKLQEIGISRGLLYLILYIGKNPGCSPSAISCDLRFDSGHTTRSIDKLVNTGFVIRKKSELDKRSYILKLTEKGQVAFASSYSLFAQWDEEAFENFSPDDQNQLITLLEKLVNTKGDLFNV